jgi:pimeloyl-ACP methyl ester carboxylesterase
MTEAQGGDEGFWNFFKRQYDDIVSSIVRPERVHYDPQVDLGPTEFGFLGRRFRRQDINLLNSRQMMIRCSWWTPDDFDDHGRGGDSLPCVVYMHANTRGRPAAIEILAAALSTGATVLAFDFAGCGLSDGTHISLGWFERHDLDCVLSFLNATGQVGKIALWGHNMGAATALLFAGGFSPPPVSLGDVGDDEHSFGETGEDAIVNGHVKFAALVLDSPFDSLKNLVKDMMQTLKREGFPTPEMVTRGGMSCFCCSKMHVFTYYTLRSAHTYLYHCYILTRIPLPFAPFSSRAQACGSSATACFLLPATTCTPSNPSTAQPHAKRQHCSALP